MPLNGIVRDGPAAESVNLSEAVYFFFADGLNVTVTVQLAYPANVLPQVLPCE